MKKGKVNFGRGKIIIVGTILIFIFIIFYLLFGKSTINHKQVVSCYLRFANYSIIQKAEYVDDTFTYLDVEQKINVDTNKIKEPLDKFKEALTSNFEKMFKQISSESTYFVEIEDNTLIFGYNMNAKDYKKLESIVDESNSDLSITDNFYDDKNRFIQNVTNQGGECIYE